jgi:hypothetical protein
MEKKTKHDVPPHFFMDSTMNPKVKTMKGQGVGACSLASSTLGVEGRAGTSRWDYED